jgi:hypothetical protein
VVLDESLAQHHDQFQPKGQRHSLTGFGKGLFGDFGGIVTPRIMLTAFPATTLARLLCLAQLTSRETLVVLQEFQGHAQDDREALGAVQGTGDPQPGQVDHVQRAFHQFQPASPRRLEKNFRRQQPVERANVVLTNLVKYVIPVFVHEHLRVLLVKSLWKNSLCQRGLFFVNRRLVPLT